MAEETIVRTGDVAERNSAYECASCGAVIELNKEQILPQCPEENMDVEWMESRQLAPAGRQGGRRLSQ